MTSSEPWKEGPWEESEHREEGGREAGLSASWNRLAWVQKPLNGGSLDHNKWHEPHKLSFPDDLLGFHLRAGITSLSFTSPPLGPAQTEHSGNGRSGQTQN